MFSMLVTGYLFLGGVGGGALVVLSALECANVRSRWSGPPAEPLRLERALRLPNEFFARAWPVCAVSLAAGMLCLLADLGRPDRVINLLVTPTPSAVAVGAYALAVSFACSCAFAWLALSDGPSPRRAAAAALAAAGVASGLVTVTYAGVLLQSLASVLFWNTPLLPALFALSALSCGAACVFLAAGFTEARFPAGPPVAHVARADGVLVAVEALCLAAYLAWALGGEGTAPAAEALVAGELAPLFWGGVAACGLAVPFALERYLVRDGRRSQMLGTAACLLAGGFALRCCMVGVAVYDVTQMPGALFGLAM